MDPARGYAQAKMLLLEHFGNEQRVAAAYIDKTLAWIPNKSEDVKAFQDYKMNSLFQHQCTDFTNDMVAKGYTEKVLLGELCVFLIVQPLSSACNHSADPSFFFLDPIEKGSDLVHKAKEFAAVSQPDKEMSRNSLHPV